MAQPVLIEVADARRTTLRAGSGRQRGGELRWASGAGMPTDPSTDRITGPLRAGFTFTGQRAGPANYVGSLMDYFARAYSPALGRFISADTIVPGAGNPAAFNRHMYVLGNPLGRVDPSGHCSGERWNAVKRGIRETWSRDEGIGIRFVASVNVPTDPGAVSDYALTDVGEDFAETFAYFALGGSYQEFQHPSTGRGTAFWSYFP